ncbi:mirror-image polydactyly gene 1 protein isoform X2 [Takifugu rubripes]|uniref:mirror-image polydactyly gene 1 protein isoform X2 n=1 Tax=Takifugu rubripes TaxID=31033 RepID=UPI0011457644|nr:mirror-image polydactyly gene 1 protein isoform X2 [Takifugu rubripes]
MASSSRAEDVQVALQRAKAKISNLQKQLRDKADSQTSSECPLTTSKSSWTLSRDLRDSLVDMYSANPQVNAELRQRLPEPIRSPDGYRTDKAGVSHTEGSPGGEGKMDLRSARDHVPQSESSRDEPEGDRGRPAVQKHPVNSEDSCHQEVIVGAITPPDRDKNISLLLKELDAVRSDNKQLLDRLVHKEKELQRKEVEEELREEQREAQSWERAAGVLEEVLAAQKDRDQALMSRLLLANEERDEAVLHARQLQQASQLDNFLLDNSDMEVDDLLQCVCDAESDQEVQQSGSALLQHLQRAKQRRHDIVTQEMKAVMEERDAAIFKCKRLEQGLVLEQEQPPRLHRKRSSRLQEAGMGVLNVHQSCEDVLTSPPSLPTENPSTAGQTLHPHDPSLLLQLELLSNNKESLEAELQRCQGAEQEAKERVRRLERLVDVLRKKVGTGSVRAVI